MPVPAILAQTCERCGAQFGPIEGAICAGCRKLLCRRHFGLRVLHGVLSRDPQFLCDACQATLPHRGDRPGPRRGLRRYPRRDD